MDVEKKIEQLREIESKYAALNHAMSLIYTDGVTVAPADSSANRAHTLGILNGMSHELVSSPEFIGLLDELSGEELDPFTRREVAVLQREIGRIAKIPADEYIAYSILTSEANTVWEQAKHENDFAAFAPYLERLIAANRRMAELWNPNADAYDVLLDTYEEGMTQAFLDDFFASLRSDIVPMITAIGEKPQPDDTFNFRYYDPELQAKFSNALMLLEGIDPRRCVLSTTEHPFTDNMHRDDVRITTHYHANDFTSSLFSVLHEGGHAIYEMGCDARYDYTSLSGGVSMGIHESQSRFYENIIGRSRAFSGPILTLAKQYFPSELADVSVEAFWRSVNKVQPSLIRTEADELTYPLHIMVRYELEKQLIAGTLSVSDLPEAWNGLYREYLGIVPPTDTEGCLQDSHWAGGSFGYFPSYALGSAYGAQMLHFMVQDVPDLWDTVSSGSLEPMTRWLGVKIHCHAGFYPPKQLFENACGPFDPSYYTNYLKAKYSELYSL